MGKQILMPVCGKVALKNAFNTSYPTVRAALRFNTNTALAKKIRHTAIKEYGGVEVVTK